MGNPAPQPRSKTSKPDLRPKHRHSGSVSNISIASDDSKPKHRHSGSVSNISISSEDFTSPSRDVSPASAGSSSSATLKERRLKRRTRSSLGGTEDFIKELDFLTPSPNRKGSESSTRKDLQKQSPKSPLSESSPLPAASEALAPVPEASIPAAVDGAFKDLSFDQANDPVVQKAGASKVNGASPCGEDLARLVSKSVQAGSAGQGASAGSNGVEPGRPVMAELCRQEPGLVINEVHEADEGHFGCSVGSENGQLPVSADAVPLLRTCAEESDITEPTTVALSESKDVPEFITEEKRMPEFPVSGSSGSNGCELSSEHQGLTSSSSSETHPAIIDATGTLLPEENSQTAPGKQELLKAEKAAKVMREEKVSVQKRIEELEKIAGARPVHFRSQSLSLPRPFDVSHARHHEAEGAKGCKMPMYKAPLEFPILSEVDSSFFGTFQDEEQPLDASENKVTALTDNVLQALPADSTLQSLALKIIAQDHEPLGVLEQDRQEELQTVSAQAIQRSDHAELHPPDESVLFDASNVEKAFLEKCVLEDEIHLENGTTAEGLVAASNGGVCLPCEKVDGMEGSAIPEENKTLAAPVGEELLDIGKEECKSSCYSEMEGGKESGPGEEDVIVFAHSVPEDLGGVPKELGNEDPSKDGSLETAEDGALGASTETLKPSTLSEAHTTAMLTESRELCTLPVALKADSLPEVPKTGETPAVCKTGTVSDTPSGQDDETSVLLTKQPAVDPLFIDSQQDRLWEMHSQELSLRDGESSGQEVRESSAQDDDPSQYANGTPTHAEVAASGIAPNGNAQLDKSGKIDRPRTPLRSLLAEEEAAEKGPGPDSGPHSTALQNQIVSPRGNLFRRIVSGGKNSPTKQTTPPKFSPKNETAAKPFLSSCMCCSVK